MSSKLTADSVAVLQMSSQDSVAANMQCVTQAVQEASERGNHTILLPENFALMPKKSSDLHIEQEGKGAVQQQLAELAKQYTINIIAGSLPVMAKERSKPYAQCIVYNQNGDCALRYNKIHLYDVSLKNGERYLESESYQAGENCVKIVNLAGLRFGLSVCYDVRFPELYRAMSREGVDVICVPSAFTYHTGQAHWETLLKARAIENQSFVIAAAQTGVHPNNRKTWGHSLIIDPWGEVLANKQHELGLIEAEINRAKINSMRTHFPALQHRRDF